MAGLSRELLAEIRRIEIVTRRLVNQQMAGHYHSVFKGRGYSQRKFAYFLMEFFYSRNIS